MAVVTQYVVVRDGAEKMTFTSKAEADAYDKMLDMAELLMLLLEASGSLSSEQQAEDVALYLAREREQVLLALGAKRPAKPKKPKPKPKPAADESDTD